jgi:hypothetical protein
MSIGLLALGVILMVFSIRRYLAIKNYPLILQAYHDSIKNAENNEANTITDNTDEE